MNYLTHQLLNSEEINFIVKELEQENQDWEDGKKTAGSHASIVKNNLQLNRNTEVAKKNAQLINKKILSSELIKSFSLPKRIHGIMFTKSSNKMHYGRHIDNPYMSSGRSDLSFTLSLTNKDFYIVFDLDGTLINSSKGIYYAYQNALKNSKINIKTIELKSKIYIFIQPFEILLGSSKNLLEANSTLIQVSFLLTFQLRNTDKVVPTSRTNNCLEWISG